MTRKTFDKFKKKKKKYRVIKDSKTEPKTKRVESDSLFLGLVWFACLFVFDSINQNLFFKKIENFRNFSLSFVDAKIKFPKKNILDEFMDKIL